MTLCQRLVPHHGHYSNICPTVRRPSLPNQFVFRSRPLHLANWCCPYSFEYASGPAGCWTSALLVWDTFCWWSARPAASSPAFVGPKPSLLDGLYRLHFLKKSTNRRANKDFSSYFTFSWHDTLYYLDTFWNLLFRMLWRSLPLVLMTERRPNKVDPPLLCCRPKHIFHYFPTGFLWEVEAGCERTYAFSFRVLLLRRYLSF